MFNETDFIQYLKEEYNSSDTTISAYLSDIKEYDYFITDKRLSIEETQAQDIKQYLSLLVNQGRSNSTINRKMVSVRKYFEYLRKKSVIDSNPCQKIKVPKVDDAPVEYLSVEQMISLLSQPDDSDLGLRDRAILELLYACGLKVTELICLNVQDIDLRIGFISCRNNALKSRIIPMGNPAKIALLAYLKSARTNLLGSAVDDGALFLNYNGARITRQGVWKIIKYYGNKAGISNKLSPQIIRNSFAVHMIKNGADIRSLQELLGNDDASITKLFMAFSKARVMDVYDKTHPRA